MCIISGTTVTTVGEHYMSAVYFSNHSSSAKTAARISYEYTCTYVFQHMIDKSKGICPRQTEEKQ